MVWEDRIHHGGERIVSNGSLQMGACSCSHLDRIKLRYPPTTGLEFQDQESQSHRVNDRLMGRPRLDHYSFVDSLRVSVEKKGNVKIVLELDSIRIFLKHRGGSWQVGEPPMKLMDNIQAVDFTCLQHGQRVHYFSLTEQETCSYPLKFRSLLKCRII